MMNKQWGDLGEIVLHKWESHIRREKGDDRKGYHKWGEYSANRR